MGFVILQAASTLPGIGHGETYALAQEKTRLSLAKLAAEDEKLSLLKHLDQDLIMGNAQVDTATYESNTY
jgi:hypothetical protein